MVGGGEGEVTSVPAGSLLLLGGAGGTSDAGGGVANDSRANGEVARSRGGRGQTGGWSRGRCSEETYSLG
jgi:hypothetical protein